MYVTRQTIISYLFLLLFLLIPATVFASGEETYEVSPDILNIRSEADRSASIIGFLSGGDQINTFEEKYGWVMTYYNGQEAWIAKHHLIPVSTAVSAESTAHSAGTLEVAASNVNIRTGPGTGYSVSASADYGERYSIIDTSGDWHHIELFDGRTGWIAGWLTSSQAGNNTVSETASIETAAATVTAPSTQGNLSGRNIVIDAGHGGNDPGAIGLNGIYEKDLVEETAEKIADSLRQAGATVITTRNGDYYVSLQQRVSISNSYMTDAFISVHYNSYPSMNVNGINTFFTHGKDQRLAQSIQSSVVQQTPLRDRGIIQENYRVLRETNADSVLVELGFISNPNDLATARTADYQFKVAKGITNGLIHYFQ